MNWLRCSSYSIQSEKHTVYVVRKSKENNELKNAHKIIFCFTDVLFHKIYENGIFLGKIKKDFLKMFLLFLRLNQIPKVGKFYYTHT